MFLKLLQRPDNTRAWTLKNLCKRRDDLNPFYLSRPGAHVILDTLVGWFSYTAGRKNSCSGRSGDVEAINYNGARISCKKSVDKLLCRLSKQFI